MAREPSNIVIEHLRRLDRKMDKVIDDLGELKTAFVALDGYVASTHLQVAGHSSELDRIKSRLDRIERRLELSEG